MLPLCSLRLGLPRDSVDRAAAARRGFALDCSCDGCSRARLRRNRPSGRADRRRRGVLARAARHLPRSDRARGPALERLPDRVRRARAARGRPGRRAPRGGGEAAGRPLLGVPIAVKDDIDVAGEVTTYGTNAYGRAGACRRRGGAPPARGGRSDHRQDERARADAVAVHRDGHVRRDAQPVGAAARARRLQRRQRGGGRRRPGRRGARLRRRGLDPDSGGVVRPVRPEAPARARVDGAAQRAAGTGSRCWACSRAAVADTALFHDVASGAIDVDVDRVPAPALPFATAAATPPARCGSPTRRASRRA